MTYRRTCVFALVLAALSMSAVSAPAFAAGETKWSYAAGQGPAKWGTLNPDFYLCKDGQRQSPIEIHDAKADLGALPSLLFDYKAVPLKVIDTGHTVQVNYAPGSYMMVAGTKYELTAIQFHKPSETRIDGKGQEMEAHLFHKTADGRQAIVAVLLAAGAGNNFTKAAFRNVPKDKGKEGTADGVTVNALDLLPKDKKAYYTFNGSITTPPCTEEITWFVLRAPGSVAADDAGRFGSLYPANARPVQPLNARPVQATH